MSNIIPGVIADTRENGYVNIPDAFNNTVTPFRPVKCTEAAKDKRDPVEGFVYYTTDTKKIYLGSNGQYLPMGGNSGIYYGNREIAEDEAENTALTFNFPLDLEEGSMVPNANDLILNIPDGCFYRVTSTSAGTEGTYEIYTDKLTIAGSGGGGGGTGTGSRIAITDTNNTYSKYYTVEDATMMISFHCQSQAATDNYVDTIEYRIGSRIIATDSTGYQFGSTINFDLKKYVDYLSTSTQNTLAVRAIDIWGNVGVRNYTINLVELKLESTYSLISSINGDSIIYPCTPIGGRTLDNKYVAIKVYEEKEPSNIIYENTIKVNTSGELINHQVDLSGCVHGIYILEACFIGSLPDGVISSNTLNHSLVYYDAAINTPLIATHTPTKQIQQYDDLNISYMIVDKASTSATVNAYLYVDDDRTDVTTNLEEVSTWKKSFLIDGSYDLRIEYGGVIADVGRITVLKYSGDIPVIDTNPTDVVLELYLTSQGRSNSEANKDTWEWVDGKGKSIEATFTDFLWGQSNGWIEDDEGSVALKLTNGAKLELPTYQPFANEATITGLTIELDFSVSGVLDYSKPLISCLSSYTDVGTGKETIATGFHITGQKATLNSDIIKATTDVIDGSEDAGGNVTNESDFALQAYTQFFNEGERIHLTYVIESVPQSVNSNSFYYVFTYLNGILSGIGRMSTASYSTREKFVQQGSYPAIFKVDSTYGDINLYNVRFYRNGLSKRTVVNNWIADLTDIDQKIALYKENDILDDDGSISLKAIQDLNYQLQVPYVIFNGGCPMQKKKTDTISYSGAMNYALPSTKSDYRLYSMKMIDALHPERNIDIPISLEDSNAGLVDKFSDIQQNTVYKPKRGVQVYGQGTSSMVYPVKNLRLRFIDKSDYPTVYDGSCPVEIICFKADFMDSSSSHNTGTANLVYNLLQGMGLRTPPQEFMLNNGAKLDEKYDITTAIRGFPIVCFYSEGDGENYRFIGRYNFNIDKATPEPFGFPGMKVYTGNTTSTGRREVEVCGLRTEVVEGMTVLPIDENGKEIEEEITQCWEILNNDPKSPSKFLTPDGYNDFLDSLNSGTGEDKNWLKYYEDRYPDEIVGDTEDGKNTLEATRAWFKVCEWLNSTQIFDSDGNYIHAMGELPLLISTLLSGQDKGLIDFNKTGDEFEVQVRNTLALAKAIDTEEDVQYVIDNKDRLNEYLININVVKNKFKNELRKHFNLDFCLFYYCLTMTLLMMDSRAKNMMIASWDQEIWYPIFYDMDSMLGINNTGFNKFSFQTEDSILDKVFTGFDSVLWNNMRECFYKEICDFYMRMRGAGLDLNNLLRIYNDESADAWNEALSTADAEYKYIDPYEKGYYDGKEGITIGPGKKNYLYAGQGPRSLHRTWWLSNRLNYLDSKYKPNTMSEIGGIDTFIFRAYSGPKQQASGGGVLPPEYEACVAAVPATQLFDITALNDSYHSIYIGGNVYGPYELKGGETAQIGISSPGQEVESAILNVNLAADIGDLSNKYMGNIAFPTGVQTRLTELNFGQSSRSHPDTYSVYYNENATSLDITNTCPYLNYLNVARLTALGTLELQECSRLEVLDAEGASSLTSIIFPQDSILHELYLPANLRNIELINQPYLEVIDMENPAVLNSVILDRVKADTYSIVRAAFPDSLNLQKTYKLIDINWLIDTDNDFTIENGEITGIRILDTLGFNMFAIGANGTAANSLTGTITIKSSNKVDEYKLYEKYSLKFPNVTIKYHQDMIDNDLLTPAIKIEFKNSDEADNSNTYTYYEVLSNGDKDLAFLTSGEILVGKALSTPNKINTVEYAYEFENKWTVRNEDNQIVATLTMNNEDVNESENIFYFNDYTPEESTIFYPVFSEIMMEYEVSIYDYDNTELFHDFVEYGTRFDTLNIPSYIYRVPSANMLEYQRYTFKGYISASDHLNNLANPTIIDLSTRQVTGKFTAYAHYEIEDATKVATDMKYFRFTNYAYEPGLTIHIADDKVRTELKGKITLPSYYDGQPIVNIGDFQNLFEVTHVYFLGDAQYESMQYSGISEGSFSVIENYNTYSQLTSIYLPTSIRSIGKYAFYNCSQLKTITLNDNITTIGEYAFASGNVDNPMTITINKLPDALTSIGGFAFNRGGDNITLDSNLPKGLTNIPQYCFNRCSNVKINIIGVPTYNNLASIGDSGLSGTLKNANMTLHIGKAVTRLASYALFGVEPSFSAIYFENDQASVEQMLSVSTMPFGDTTNTAFIYGNLGL